MYSVPWDPTIYYLSTDNLLKVININIDFYKILYFYYSLFNLYKPFITLFTPFISFTTYYKLITYFYKLLLFVLLNNT